MSGRPPTVLLWDLCADFSSGSMSIEDTYGSGHGIPSLLVKYGASCDQFSQIANIHLREAYINAVTSWNEPGDLGGGVCGPVVQALEEC